MATLFINIKDRKGRINPEIYGHFSEHLGRCIYNGIYVGEDSSIPNTKGIRNDIIEAFKNIRMPVLRWPGGCFADEYHWKDGIGEDRPPRYHPIPDPANPVWRHEFGTDEFLKLCELTGADPVITVNTATGTCEEFLDWYEYINGAPETKYGQMRACNGHPEPYHVYYWAFGNTDDNVWQTDFNHPEGYAHTYRKFQSVIRGEREKLYQAAEGLQALRCPVCGGDLTRQGDDFACAQRHRVNVNRKGCLNFLSAPVDSCVKAERASDAPAKFHTFKSGMFIVIR